jgi:tetratricopeptide (TPR) repeat protein
MSRGDPDGAIADCTRAIDLNPGHALPYQNRAAAFHEKGDFEAAIADATKSIDLKPNGDVYFNRGLARAATNDLDGAIADYTEAVRLKPGLAMAYLHRGEVLLFQFKDAEAQKDFDRCLKLQPNLNPDMARVIDNAKQARGEKR